MADTILPNFKALEKYCNNLLQKYNNYKDQLDLVVTPTLTKCMFPIEDMPNMFGRDFDDDLKGQNAQDLWSFVQNIKGTADCHLTRRPNEVTIKVLTLANMLFNMNNGGKGLIIS